MFHQPGVDVRIFVIEGAPFEFIEVAVDGGEVVV
jgi:hypothetical protein